MRKTVRSLVALASLALPLAALAAPLVAVVESVKGDVEGIAFMDYVAAGQVIRLGPRDTIVLGYLKSCLRETITGGTVIVLDDQSLVQAGEVRRSTVKCDPARASIHPGDSKENAGNVFRSGPRLASAPSDGPPVLVLYGRSPMLEIGAARGTLTIERRDRTEPPITHEVRDGAVLRGRFIDLAAARIALAPGGRYRASLGTAGVDFAVDAGAEPGAGPIAGRLLRFD